MSSKQRCPHSSQGEKRSWLMAPTVSSGHSWIQRFAFIPGPVSPKSRTQPCSSDKDRYLPCRASVRSGGDAEPAVRLGMLGIPRDPKCHSLRDGYCVPGSRPIEMGWVTIFFLARSSFARNLLGLRARAIRGLVCGALFHGFRPVFAAAEGIAVFLAQPRRSRVAGSGSAWGGRGAAVRRDGWVWVWVSAGEEEERKEEVWAHLDPFLVGRIWPGSGISNCEPCAKSRWRTCVECNVGSQGQLPCAIWNAGHDRTSRSSVRRLHPETEMEPLERV